MFESFLINFEYDKSATQDGPAFPNSYVTNKPLSSIIIRDLTLTGNAIDEIFYLKFISSIAFSRQALFLPTMVDALVVVEAVQSSEHFMTECADRAVQRLKVLLLFVSLQSQLCRQSLPTNVACVAHTGWQKTTMQRMGKTHRQDRWRRTFSRRKKIGKCKRKRKS